MSVEMRRHYGIGAGTLLTGNSRHVHVLRIRNAAAKGGGARHTPTATSSIYRYTRVFETIMNMYLLYLDRVIRGLYFDTQAFSF